MIEKSKDVANSAQLERMHREGAKARAKVEEMGMQA